MKPNQYAHLGQMPDETLSALGFKHDGQYWSLGSTRFSHVLTPEWVANALREDGIASYKRKLLEAIATEHWPEEPSP